MKRPVDNSGDNPGRPVDNSRWGADDPQVVHTVIHRHGGGNPLRAQGLGGVIHSIHRLYYYYPSRERTAEATGTSESDRDACQRSGMSALTAARPIDHLPPLSQPVAGLDVLALQDAISALLDREHVCSPDERARLQRVRHDLERRAADLLDE